MSGIGFGFIRSLTAAWIAFLLTLLGGCTGDIKEAQFVWRDRCQNVIERGAIAMIKHHDCFRVCVKNYANPCRQMCENGLLKAKADRKIILTTCRIKFTRFVRRQCTLYCEMSSGQLARKMAQRRRDRILGRRHSFCDEDDNDIYAEVRPFGQVQADDDDEEQMLIDLFDKNQNDDGLLTNLFGEGAGSSRGRGRGLGDDLDSITARDEPVMDGPPVGASVGYGGAPVMMMAAPAAAPAPASSSAASGAMSLLGQGLQAFTSLKGQQMQQDSQTKQLQLQEQTQLQQQQMQNQAQLQQQQMQYYSTPAGAAAAALSNPSTVGALGSLGSSIGSGASSLFK